MKVTAILKGKKDQLGRNVIYIRTNIGEKRTFRATHIRVEQSQFKAGKVINHPKAKQLNEKIREAIIEAEMSIIKKEQSFPDADYRTYMNLLLRRWDIQKVPATLKQFETENIKFLDWNGDTKISRVTLSNLNDYKAYLNKRYKGSNTVWKGFKNVRTLFTEACAEKVINPLKDPFDEFEMPVYKDPKKGYLTQEEVDRIEQYFYRDCPDGLKLYTAWFLIGCSSGLRFSDMCQFDRKEHIKASRFTLHTIKTGEMVSIPFKEKLQCYFEAIDYQPMIRSNQKFNKNLKILQDACDISLTLTVHVSRHTFAVRCASAGIPIEVTAKLMAQTDTKSTAVYYKITDHKVDQEFNKLF